MSRNLQVQVIGNLQTLGHAKRYRQSSLPRNQSTAAGPVSDRVSFLQAEHAAFIRSIQSLAVWTDNVKDFLPQMEGMQTAMMDFLFQPNASLAGGEASRGAASSNLASVSDLVRHHSWPQHPRISAEHPYVRISSVCRCPPLVTRTTRTDVDISPSDSYPQARSSWSN